MSRHRRGAVITVRVLVVGILSVALAGAFMVWVTVPTTVATTTTVSFGGNPAALFPRSRVTPVANGLALTPPMGWNGFNRYHTHVTAAIVEADARALVSSGMKAAGYSYVNLDGGWDLRTRSAAGRLQPDPAKFPQGIAPVAAFVHSLGLKFGIYTSAGTMNCAATSAGSYGYYQQDAETFAAWGVDYLKLDWCFVPYNDYPQISHQQLSYWLANEMREALTSTGRPIVYDVNDPHNEPWRWAQDMANMWRTAPDSRDRYSSLVTNFMRNVSLYQRAGTGGWNDPDMLEVGNGGMSATEYQAQFSLWAEMAAPLIAGNDLTTMSPMNRSILTNLSVIAVDQDPLGRQGYPVQSTNGRWVLTKPLAGGGRAVVIFNQSDAPASISTTMMQVGLADGRKYRLLNLWTGAATETTGDISVRVPAHRVVMYLVTAA